MATLMVFTLAACAASAGSLEATPRLLCEDDANQCSSSGHASLGLLQRRSRKVVASKTKRHPKWEGAAAKVLPVAWFHVPKCGSSFLSALIRIPGACSGIPDDFEITDENMGLDNNGGFWHKYPSNSNCPQAFRTYGEHRGLGNESNYEMFWKGHAMTMLREPAQRLLSAWHDNKHSWPASLMNPPPTDLKVFANAVQGCAVKMLTRPGNSYEVDVFANFGDIGPHWGGPCGDSPPATWAEVREAKRRLREGFVFVGIDEEWALSMCLFHDTVGGRCYSAEFVDSRHQVKPKHTHNESRLDAINFTDPYDGALYEEAKKIFWERFAAHNLSIDACQPCFAQANVTFP